MTDTKGTTEGAETPASASLRSDAGSGPGSESAANETAAGDHGKPSESAVRDTPTAFEFSDIAALLVLMLRNLDSNNRATYQTFDDQLNASMNMLPNDAVFSKSLRVISFLHKTKPALFVSLHEAVRDLLLALEATRTDQNERWSVCAFVSQDQIKHIARLV